MITEQVVNGSKETTFHNISISTSAMDIQLSAGEYYRNNTVLFHDADGGTITVPTTDNKDYVLYLMPNNEVCLFQYTDPMDLYYFTQKNEIVDRIAWFSIGVGVTTLDGVEISFVKLVDKNAN